MDQWVLEERPVWQPPASENRSRSLPVHNLIHPKQPAERMRYVFGRIKEPQSQGKQPNCQHPADVSARGRRAAKTHQREHRFAIFMNQRGRLSEVVASSSLSEDLELSDSLCRRVWVWLDIAVLNVASGPREPAEVRRPHVDGHHQTVLDSPCLV